MAADNPPKEPVAPATPLSHSVGGGADAAHLNIYFEIITKAAARPDTVTVEALQRIQVKGNPLKPRADQQTKRRFLHTADDLIDYNDSSFGNRSRNAEASLRVAIALTIYARFYMGTTGWQQADADEYLERADTIANDILDLREADFIRAGLETVIIEGMLQTLKAEREGYYWRRSARDKQFDDVSLRLEERARRIITRSSATHAAFFHPLRAELSAGSFARLHENLFRVRKAITSIINAENVNDADPMFRAFDADLPMQANYDAHTVIARLYECEAKLLILDSLSCGGELSPRTSQEVTSLLRMAARSLRKSKYLWWHGYGNFVVTAAVADYAHGRFDAFLEKLGQARNIFRDTNDLWRMGEVSEILNRMVDFGYPALTQCEVEKLLFDE